MIKIEYVDIDKLKPYENNPRNIENAIEPVKNSIENFGIKVPFVVDKDYVIITGHTRYQACLELNIKQVPCIIAEDLNEIQAKAFRLADNKVAEFSSWDFDILADELEELDMEMNIFGFVIKDESYIPAESLEINLDSFSDEQFEYECPNCGFRFNE